MKSETEATTRVFQPGEMQLVFKGDKLLATGLVTHGEKAVAFTIDPSATPKQFDYWRAENARMPCIYEVSGDTLRIAVPRGGSVRPSRISAEKGSGSVVITLKRQSAPETE